MNEARIHHRITPKCRAVIAKLHKHGADRIWPAYGGSTWQWRINGEAKVGIYIDMLLRIGLAEVTADDRAVLTERGRRYLP